MRHFSPLFSVFLHLLLGTHHKPEPGKKGQVAWWQDYVDTANWIRFRKMIEEHFEHKKLSVTLDESAGVVQTDSNVTYGLQNILQQCAQIPVTQWSDHIATHFDNIHRAMEDADEFSAQLTSYEKVKDLLVVRLWPDGATRDTNELVYRRDFAGVLSVLAYDLPNSVKSASPTELEHWDKSPNDVFNVALANVLKNYPPQIAQHVLGEGIKVWLFEGENFYVASHALLLDQYQQYVGEYGALVGIPCRDTMICYPIDDIQVVKAINSLIPVIYEIDKKGPGSVTPNLFWYHQGEFTLLPYEIADKTLTFFPPDTFVHFLNSLATNERPS